jgi:hypothetical protein
MGKLIPHVPEQKGISKLAGYLKSKSVSDADRHIEFLRDLQLLRSTGAAHRKSDNYEKAAKKFGLDEKDPRAVFTDLLSRATEFLSAIDKL